MVRVFHPYTEWEDYQNGMYCTAKRLNEKELIGKAVTMLTDLNLFYQTCTEIVKTWPLSAAVNLTDKGCSRKAWLGQAACNYKYHVPEYLTRVAWGRLTPIQRIQADGVAWKIIRHFELRHENKNREIYFNLGETLL
jgi:hypothetical protein